MSISSVLRVEGVAFAHPRSAAPVFSSLAFTFEPGWTGVVGENGAGKSTLLALLAGALAPTEGRLTLTPRGGSVVLCHQRVGPLDDDVRALAKRSDGDAQRMRAMLRLDADALERWPTLSPGERRRWKLGASIVREPDVLLVDEPEAYLDTDARAWLRAALAAHRGIGVLVSHDRALLDDLTTATLWLADGAAEHFPLPYSDARRERERERERARREHDASRARAKRAEDRLRAAREEHASAERMRSSRARMKGPRDHDARGALAKGLAARAEKRHGRKVAVLRGEASRRAERLGPPPPVELGRSVFARWERPPVATLAWLEAAAVYAGDAVILHDVSIGLARDARVHLRGPNGAGKSTLLRALVDAASPPVRERFLVLGQDASAGEDAALVTGLRALPRDVLGRVMQCLAALGVEPAAMLSSAQPSPGAARKLRLALGLATHAWALLLDEPESYLDAPSLERLEHALVAYPGALVLITHDARFASACTREAWTLEQGRVR